MSALMISEQLRGGIRSEVDLSGRSNKIDSRPIGSLSPVEKWQRLDEEKLADVNEISVAPSKFPYAKELGLMLVPRFKGEHPPRDVREIERKWGLKTLQHLNRGVNNFMEEKRETDQVIYGVNGGPFRSIRELIHIQVAGIKSPEWNYLDEESLDAFKFGVRGLITNNVVGKEITAIVGEKITNLFPNFLSRESLQIRPCGSAYFDLKNHLSEETDFCKDQFEVWKTADAMIREEFNKRDVGLEYRCHAISFGQEQGICNATMTIHAAIAFGKTNGGIMESNRLILSSRTEKLTEEQNELYFATGDEFAQMMN